MANVIRIKRKIGTDAAPSSLKSAELAWNDEGNILYIGKGDSNGDATSVVAIGGSGSFLTTSAASTNYQPKDATLTAVAGVSTAADKYVYFTDTDTATAGTITSYGRSLIDDTDASTARTTLGLGSMSTESTSDYYTKTAADTAFQPKDATLTAVAGVSTAADKYVYFTDTDTATVGTISSYGRSLVDDADASTARTTLGLGSMSTESTSDYYTKTAADTAFQPKDATLTALAGVSSATDKYVYFTDTDTATVGTITSYGRSLVDDTDASTARTTLGLGSIATESASTYLTVTDAGNTYLPLTGGTISQNLTVTGNLTVNGTTTTISSTTINVGDKNIELGKVTSPTDTTADGGGLTLKGSTDKTFNWVDSSDAWTSSEHMDLASGKAYYINGSSVLSGSTLGSGVTSSSLTSVGTLTGGSWTANIIGMAYGGSGANLSGAAEGTIFKKHVDGYLVAASAGSDYLSNASTVDGGTY